MCKSSELKPIDQTIADYVKQQRAYLIEHIKYSKQNVKDTVAAIQRNRRILPIIEAAGFATNLCQWSKGDCVTIDLGFYHSGAASGRRLADKLRYLRKLLDSKFSEPQKEVAPSDYAVKNCLRFTMKLVDYPGVRVCFYRKIPKGAKCRVVTERSTYKRLVCEC